MKIVMTLLVRDEEDILDAQIAFHLNAGVDFVVAIDNGSRDATTDILESYARAGYLQFAREDDREHYEQETWVSRMARSAATELGADWVINADADEFWWPRSGSLKDIFAAVPPSFGAVRGMWRHFAPRPDPPTFFADRMTVRVCNPGALSNSPYSSRFKTAHRADPDVSVGAGNHLAWGDRLTPLRGWYPIDVLHFPIRSIEQCEHKYRRWWEPMLRAGMKLPAVYRLAYEAHRDGRFEEFYSTLLVDDARLEQGLSDGTLAIDTRLRDLFRLLLVKGSNRRDRFDVSPKAVPFPESPVDESYLSELGRMADATAEVVAQRRVNALQARLELLEGSLSSRLRGRLKSAQGRLADRVAESRVDDVDPVV